MIINALEDTYIAALSDPDMGYTEVTPLDLLDHLIARYGEITQPDIEANREKLSQPWDPSTEIETLWTKIRQVQQYATAAGEAIANTTVIRLTLKMFEKDNVFPTYADTWQKPTRHSPISNSSAKHRAHTMTARDAGYNGAAFHTTANALNLHDTVRELRE